MSLARLLAALGWLLCACSGASALPDASTDLPIEDLAQRLDATPDAASADLEVAADGRADEAPPPDVTGDGPADAGLQLDIGPPLTVAGVGSGQALELRDGLLWVAGDAATGVLVAVAFDLEAATLQPTGEQLALTRGGVDLVPHPTGLTHHPEVGTFLGGTEGTAGQLHVIDWAQLRADGNLDRAVLASVSDDLAVAGTRPELVRVGDRWMLATADYGEVGGGLRLYDPARVMTVQRTSEPGVLLAELAAPPLVQSLRWIDQLGLLVLVQNRALGTGWRLTWVDLARSLAEGQLAVVAAAEPALPGEAEALILLGPEDGLFLSSATVDNLRFVHLRFP